MATVTQDMSVDTVRKLSVARLAATGAVAAAVFYALCWIGAVALTGPASHMYVQLFTSAEINSGAALLEGIIWSIAFGLIAGALVALFYNVFAFLDRK